MSFRFRRLYDRVQVLLTKDVLQTVSSEVACAKIELGEQLDQLSSLQTHNKEHLEQTSSAVSASESMASITSRHNRYVETLMCTHENTISALRTGFESQISVC